MSFRVTPFFVLLIALCFSLTAKAQLPPLDPNPCSAKKNLRLIVSAPPSFVLNNLTDFSKLESKDLKITVETNNDPYTVYIAGVITAPPGTDASNNVMIPLDLFTVSATNPNGVQTPAFKLSGTYQVLAVGQKAKSRDHQITISRGILEKFPQAPGTHTLYLHIKVCQ